MGGSQDFGTSDVYNKFSNFFELSIQEGSLFEVPSDKSEGIRDDLKIWDQKNNRYVTFTSIEDSYKQIEIERPLVKRLVVKKFCEKLRSAGYKPKNQKGKGYVYYNPSDMVKHSNTDVFNIYEGFEFRILEISSGLVLVVDPKIIFEFAMTLKDLLRAGLDTNFLKNQTVFYLKKQEFGLGSIQEIKSEDASEIYDFREKKVLQIENVSINLERRPELIQEILNRLNKRGDVVHLLRQLSFLDSRTASKDRFTKTIDVLKKFSVKDIFPLNFGEFSVDLERIAVPLRL